jgi:membrane associated rhomboid family serine protease
LCSPGHIPGLLHLEDTGTIGLIISGIILAVSVPAFYNKNLFNRLSFRVDAILGRKEYYRLITSGFLHADWLHLFFNLITLLFFSRTLELTLGYGNFIILYTASLIGGNLLSLLLHKNQGWYTAIGASGAISGVVFASIALFPNMEVSLLILPVFVPGWIFGIAYALYSIYGIRSQKDNIGHDAHLGGGLIGMVTVVIMIPEALKINYVPILLIFVPSVVFIYAIIKLPRFTLGAKLSGKPKGDYTIEDVYNTRKLEREKEINRILDKIGRSLR